MRRLAHLHARRVRRDRVRHRHHAGARRARDADPGARAAQGAPHRGRAASSARASTPRTSSCTSSASSASTAASASPTSTPARSSTRLSMEERMTVCNMSIEGGARFGYVNPDETTFDVPRRAASTRRRARPGTRRSPAGRSIASRRRRQLRRRRAASTPPTSRRRSPGASTPARPSRSTERVPEPSTDAQDESERPRSRRRSSTWARGRASRSRARRWTSLHRLLHQRPPVGLPRGGALPQGPQGGAGRARAGRAGLRRRSRALAERRGARQGLPRGGLRVARGRLLDVPGDEPRQARRRPALRVVVEPQLQGPPGQPDRPHPADEPGDGRGRRGRAAAWPTPAKCSRSTDRRH